MRIVNIIICSSILLLSNAAGICQTAGSGTLSTIESLAKKEEENSNKIGELNRKHMDSYVSEDIKSKRLQSELEDLEKKKKDEDERLKKKLENKQNEIATSATWANRKKSAQSGWKEYSPGTCGAGGPPPICPVNHWYSVSVSEAMREYNALVEKELDKIKNEQNKYDKEIGKKKAEITDFQDGENEFSELRDKINNDINKIQGENEDIRQRIAELSKTYVNQIEGQIKSMQNTDIGPVMTEIAQKHFSILKIGVLEAKKKELDQDEKNAVAELNDKLRKENDKKIADINMLISKKQNEISLRQASTNAEVNTLNLELTQLRNEEQNLEKLLNKKEQLTTDQISKSTVRLNEVKSLISSTIAKIESANNTFREFKDRTEGEMTTSKNEAWNLQVNLPALIREAENNLRQAFSAKREVLDDALSGRKSILTSLEASIANKRDEFRNKAKDYEKLVEPERIRLMQACKDGGASCWGSDVTSKIWLNANKLLSCASDMESNIVLYTGCEEAFSHYTSMKNALINGISDEDLGKMMRYNPDYRYQKILEKINR